ncbi:hypothetical protein ACG909_18745, partial [Acinetobacter geminorum]
IGCTIDFRCRLLHLEIILLKKPSRIALCNKAYPHIEIDLLFSENSVDINEHKFDIILKFEEEITDVNTFTLNRYKRNFYATPAFLKKYGKPKSIEDLRKHNIYLYSRSDLQRLCCTKLFLKASSVI